MLAAFRPPREEVTDMSDPRQPDELGDDAVLTPSEQKLAAEERARREAEDNMETALFDGIRAAGSGPVDPVRLTRDDTFSFRCHKGVSCWNACCHGADVTLTPQDIITLARHFWVTPAKFVADYVVPAIHEGSGLPVAKLVMTGRKGEGPCVFMDDETGCMVYDDRPATCRYYPLGLGAVKMKGHDSREDMYFLVKETHCQGHAEELTQSVQTFRAEQGVEPYDLINERWIDILMKMASWRSMGGPMGQDVSKQTKQMFYMVSTDIDAFRRFVFETKFLEIYEIDADMIESIKTNDEALLQLGFDWLRNVMFNEETIGMKPAVLQEAIGKARSGMGAA